MKSELKEQYNEYLEYQNDIHSDALINFVTGHVNKKAVKRYAKELGTDYWVPIYYHFKGETVDENEVINYISRVAEYEEAYHRFFKDAPRYNPNYGNYGPWDSAGHYGVTAGEGELCIRTLYELGITGEGKVTMYVVIYDAMRVFFRSRHDQFKSMVKDIEAKWHKASDIHDIYIGWKWIYRNFRNTVNIVGIDADDDIDNTNRWLFNYDKYHLGISLYVLKALGKVSSTERWSLVYGIEHIDHSIEVEDLNYQKKMEYRGKTRKAIGDAIIPKMHWYKSNRWVGNSSYAVERHPTTAYLNPMTPGFKTYNPGKHGLVSSKSSNGRKVDVDKGILSTILSVMGSNALITQYCYCASSSTYLTTKDDSLARKVVSNTIINMSVQNQYTMTTLDKTELGGTDKIKSLIVKSKDGMFVSINDFLDHDANPNIYNIPNEAHPDWYLSALSLDFDINNLPRTEDGEIIIYEARQNFIHDFANVANFPKEAIKNFKLYKGLMEDDWTIVKYAFIFDEFVEKIGRAPKSKKELKKFFKKSAKKYLLDNPYASHFIKYGVRKKDIKGYIDLFDVMGMVNEAGNMYSTVKYKVNDSLYGEVLSCDNPDYLLAGEATDCCMVLSNSAVSLVRRLAVSGDNGIIAVYEKEDLKVMAYFIIKDGVLFIDSVEARSKYRQRRRYATTMKNTIDEFVKKNKFKGVVISKASYGMTSGVRQLFTPVKDPDMCHKLKKIFKSIDSLTYFDMKIGSNVYYGYIYDDDDL